jgi:hypothetical protein
MTIPPLVWALSDSWLQTYALPSVICPAPIAWRWLTPHRVRVAGVTRRQQTAKDFPPRVHQEVNTHRPWSSTAHRF